MPKDKTLIISAINFFEGGPLSVLNDSLTYLNSSNYISRYRIIALVHKTNLFDQEKYKNIEFIEYPKSRKSYVYRLYYEYSYFKKFAAKHNVNFWLSLHDITPNLNNIEQAVYCHNPSPFNSVNIKDIVIQPTQFFFRLFYRYLYAINIKKNKKVIVQQQWIKKEFQKMFSLDEKKIIIAQPQVPVIPQQYLMQQQTGSTDIKTFFFPTFPRPFKNIEIIGEAVKLLNKDGFHSFRVIITLDGSENKYAETIIDKYGLQKNLEFIGLIKREEVYEIYTKTDCLIFPSKLETWGLPISEFKQFRKPIISVDLPYAKETIGAYTMANFFDPNNPVSLANEMKKIIQFQKTKFSETEKTTYIGQVAYNWDELFSILLC